jgi:hypothetical protein
VIKECTDNRIPRVAENREATERDWQMTPVGDAEHQSLIPLNSCLSAYRRAAPREPRGFRDPHRIPLA